MIFWEGGYYHRGNYDAVNLLTQGHPKLQRDSRPARAAVPQRGGRARFPSGLEGYYNYAIHCASGLFLWLVEPGGH